VDGGLLKCFVVREKLRMGSVRFCMYLGTQSDSPTTAKFLLAALQTSRYLPLCIWQTEMKTFFVADVVLRVASQRHVPHDIAVSEIVP